MGFNLEYRFISCQCILKCTEVGNLSGSHGCENNLCIICSTLSPPPPKTESTLFIYCSGHWVAVLSFSLLIPQISLKVYRFVIRGDVYLKEPQSYQKRCICALDLNAPKIFQLCCHNSATQVRIIIT